YILDRLGDYAYKCPSCCKAYKYPKNRNTHMKYECGQEPRFRCPVKACGYRGKRKAHLTSHITHRHRDLVGYI
ncbi:hypothetical protein QE152_g19542, partial [Popillia japonica]